MTDLLLKRIRTAREWHLFLHAPTRRRAKIKAARKANVNRMRRKA